MIITFPQDTTDIIDSIRGAIGREITAYIPVSGIACSICSLDLVTNLSTDPFCTVCGGYYWKDTVSAYVMSAYIFHPSLDTPVRVAGGYIVTGDTFIQVKYTQSSYAAVNTAESFLVDGKEYLKKDISLRGVPSINRIVVTLEEQEG